VVMRWRLRQGRECRRLRKRQLLRRLAEVQSRRGLDAVRSTAEIDVVEIHLEYLALLEARLDHPRNAHLLELALHRALAPRQRLREDVARELHRDRARPLRHLECTDVRERGADHADPVDALVVPEATVLD